MARGFNLTAQLNLTGPANIRPVISRLRRQLGNISVTINPVVDPAAARNVTALQNSLTGLNRTLTQTATLANNTARAVTNLSTAAAGIGANLRGLPNNINAAAGALNRVGTAARTTQNNIQQAATGFEEFGRQSGLAVRRFAAFATVTGVIYKFTNALSSATTQFIDFNQELVRVAQVTDSSLKDLGPLVRQITALSTGLGVASKDLITVSSTLAQAGLSARDTEKALEALALSALAPSFDSLNDTVEGSIALMRQFGIGAGDLKDALGSVNAVAAAFAVESSDLITAIQRTGGVFAAASKGVSEGKDALNEFLAIFTSIRQTTRESAETIATGLRTIFTRIQRGKTIDALKEYGVVLTDLSGKFVGPYEAVRRLSEGLSALDPRDLKFSSIVEELGGFRQIGKVIPLIQQFAVAQQALKIAQEGQGSLAADAATAQLSLANRLTKVREEFNALIRSVGESSSFQTFVKLSLDLASALIRLADSAKNVLPALTAIAAFRGAAALGSFARGFSGSVAPRVATPNKGGYIRGFATGGMVPGSGTGDSVPAMLTPGEFVMNKRAVQKYGMGNLVRMNKAGTVAGGMDKKRRAYFFDFDDTLAVSGAMERPGEPDPYSEFRGTKGRAFVEAASATRYASMAKRKAAEGYDVWVLTARPGDKDTVRGIKTFGANNGLAFKGVIGVAGMSQRKGVDTASAKSMILSRYSKMYPDGIVFLDDASENVLQASQVPGVKARIAKKSYGGLLQRFAAGGSTDPKTTLERYRADSAEINLDLANSKNLDKSRRKQRASEIRDLRQLREPVPAQLYSSISRVAFDKFARDVGLNKNPIMPEGTRLFDQAKYYSAEVAKIQGKSFSLPGFVSTSKDFPKAKMFLDNAPRDKDRWAAMFTINTKPNALGVDVVKQLEGRNTNITKQDINPRTGKMETFYMNPPSSENEVILSPRSRFKVNNARFVDLIGNKNIWADLQQYAKGGSVTDFGPLVYGFVNAGEATKKQAQEQQKRKRGRPAGGPKGDILEVSPGLVDLLFLKVGKNPPKSQTSLLSLSENYPGDKALMDKYKGAGALRFSYGSHLLDPQASTAFANNLVPAIESSITNLANTVGSIKNLSPTPLPPVNPGIVSDRVQSRLDSEVIDAISGYFFEGIINSLTGAPLTEAQATWDFLSPAGDVKDKLDTLFGPGENKANISGKFLEAKATYDANIITDATKSNSIRNKIVTSLNKGEITPSIIKNPATQTKRTGGKIKRFATGGLVPGVGNTDSVPMQLPVGSFVIRKSSVNKIGADNLASMAGYATGGNVKTVDALVTPGEWIFSPDQASKIGSGTLNSMNKFGKFAKGGSVGIQKFAAGGFPTALAPAMSGLSAKETARLSSAIMNNVDAFNVLEAQISGLPTDQMLKAMRIFTSKLEGGATDINRAATEASTLAKSGGGGSRQPKKGGVGTVNPPVVGPPSPADLTAGVTESRNVTNPVGPRGFAASQARINAISANIKTYQRGSDIVESRNNPVGVGVPGGRIQRLQNYASDPLNTVAGRANQTAAIYQQKAVNAGPSVKGDIYQVIAGFNKALAGASTGLSKLTSSSTYSAQNIKTLGMSALTGAGKGIGGTISRIGGGAMSMLGLGRFSTAGRAAMAGGGGTTGGTTTRDGMGGMGGGMMAMMLPMVGGMAVEQLSKSFGGETTDTGRRIGSMGSQALNYGSMGAMVGSMFGPFGTAIGGAAGALAGLTMGFFEAEKAGKEYAQTQKQAAADLAMEKSGTAIEKFAQSGNTRDMAVAMEAFKASSEKEAAVGAGVERTQAGYFTSAESMTDFAQRKAKTQKAGADQAEKLLSAAMMKSGKTFEEMSKSMDPAEFKMLAQNIAEADQSYAYFQAQRASEISRLKSEGRGAEAAALEARTITDQETLAKNIAQRQMKEHDAAVAAQKAAAASKALAATVDRAILNLERTFEIMNQSMQRTSFEFEQAGARIQEITSGQVNLASGQDLSRQMNVLENPEAYGAAERNKALASSAAIIGPQGAMTARISQFGPNARNEAMRIGNRAAATGATNEDIGIDIKDTLRRQIEAAYGADTDIGRNAVRKMMDSVDKAIKETPPGEPVDVNAVVDAAVGPLMKASEQASKTLIEANKMAANALSKLAEVSQAVADAQQRQIDRTNALRDMQRESSLKTREALGIKVTGQERIRSRTAGAAQRLGFSRPEDVNAANMAAARQRAVAEQGRLMAQRPAMEQAAVTGNQAAVQNLVAFNTRLAKVNQTVKDLDKELGDLPQLLESNLNDVLSEMQDRVNDLESRKEAGASFAEKLVGSTPQEMIELNRTFALLQNTLRGNLITIQRSDVAQMAYVTALQQGKTVQEAVMDAQTAYANQNKAALGLFNELTQMSGVKGPAFDLMRADLMENLARAQGMGLQNNPMFRSIIEELRKTPEQRAQQDPVLQALVAQANAIKQAQIEAVKEQNQIDRDAQAALLNQVGAKIIQDLNAARVNINVAVQQGARVVGANVARANGGLIYASKGTLINYEPKGTDTVPAMLTPGEFVINRAATQKHLPLLQAINSGHMSKGGVVYLADGGETPNDLSGTSQRTANAFDIENTQRQNTMLKTLDMSVSDVASTTNNINRDTGTIKDVGIPGLSQQGSEGLAASANSFKSLGTAIAQLSKELSPAKKPLSDFYTKFDTFSGRSAATLANISDSADFVVAAATKISDDIAEAINILRPAAGAQGIGQMLGNMFGRVNFGQIIRDALNNAMGAIGPMLGFSGGGVVYASKGQFINFQPRGTDTVPAMLTPGEFVVNRSATQKHLPLLQNINNGTSVVPGSYSQGGIVYMAGGGLTGRQRSLVAGFRQENIRRYESGLTPDTWVMIKRKTVIDKNEPVITFVGNNFQPLRGKSLIRGANGELTQSPLFRLREAWKTIAPNKKQAAAAANKYVKDNNLAIGEKWRKDFDLINGIQVANAANMQYDRKMNAADKVIEEALNQMNMTKIIQFEGTGHTVPAQNGVKINTPLGRAMYLNKELEKEPGQINALATSIGKRFYGLQQAKINAMDGIDILNKIQPNLYIPDNRINYENVIINWLNNQKNQTEKEANFLKDVWLNLGNARPVPPMTQPSVMDLFSYPSREQTYTPMKYSKGGIVYAENGGMMPKSGWRSRTFNPSYPGLDREQLIKVLEAKKQYEENNKQNPVPQKTRIGMYGYSIVQNTDGTTSLEIPNEQQLDELDKMWNTKTGEISAYGPPPTDPGLLGAPFHERFLAASEVLTNVGEAKIASSTGKSSGGKFASRRPMFPGSRKPNNLGMEELPGRGSRTAKPGGVMTGGYGSINDDAPAMMRSLGIDPKQSQNISLNQAQSLAEYRQSLQRLRDEQVNKVKTWMSSSEFLQTRMKELETSDRRYWKPGDTIESRAKSIAESQMESTKRLIEASYQQALNSSEYDFQSGRMVDPEKVKREGGISGWRNQPSLPNFRTAPSDNWHMNSIQMLNNYPQQIYDDFIAKIFALTGPALELPGTFNRSNILLKDNAIDFTAIGTKAPAIQQSPMGQRGMSDTINRRPAEELLLDILLSDFRSIRSALAAESVNVDKMNAGRFEDNPNYFGTIEQKIGGRYGTKVEDTGKYYDVASDNLANEILRQHTDFRMTEADIDPALRTSKGGQNIKLAAEIIDKLRRSTETKIKAAISAQKANIKPEQIGLPSTSDIRILSPYENADAQVKDMIDSFDDIVAFYDDPKNSQEANQAWGRVSAKPFTTVDGSKVYKIETALAKKGYGKHLYSALIEYITGSPVNGGLIEDFQQTPDAIALWNRIKKDPSFEQKIVDGVSIWTKTRKSGEQPSYKVGLEGAKINTDRATSYTETETDKPTGGGLTSIPKSVTNDKAQQQTPKTKAFGSYSTGGIVYASKGRLIPYQPKGTDTVPAMLTPGEFVVNKQASQRNLPLLQSINSGQYSSGGKISYLSAGTPGVDAFNKQMMLLTEILRISADSLDASFTNIVDKINNINFRSPEQVIQNNTGVSNNTNPLAAIQALGNKLDQFIIQLQESIPPSITLEVSQPIPVNVNINGAAALQNLLNGPLSSMIQNIISDAFNADSRKREGQ